jgi:hypothetical protein
MYAALFYGQSAMSILIVTVCFEYLSKSELITFVCVFVLQVTKLQTSVPHRPLSVPLSVPLCLSPLSSRYSAMHFFCRVLPPRSDQRQHRFHYFITQSEISAKSNQIRY